MTSFQRLSILFSRLPGIGPKGANRIIVWLLKASPTTAEELSQALHTLHQSIIKCSLCYRYIDRTEPDALGRCVICRNPNREHTIVCVVAESVDSQIIEETKAFQGRYHVLGGLLDPLEGVTADDLTIASLVTRLERDHVKELIFAFNEDMRGETTALYLKSILSTLSKQGLVISRLARGLPKSALIEYADPMTLADALKGRRSVS